MTIITAGVQPSTLQSTTAPANVKELAYFLNYRAVDLTVDVIKITFLFNDLDLIDRSVPDRFKVRVRNMETGFEKTLITQNNIEIPMTELNGDTEIFVTSINSFGSSPESKFILPLTDIIFLDADSNGAITIKNNLSTIKRTRDDFGIKPRWILFYRNVSFQDIQDDFTLLTSVNPNSQTGSISSEDKFLNQEFYGEIRQDEALVMDHQFDTFDPEDDFGFNPEGLYYMKYSATGWIFQPASEIAFIEEFKEAIIEQYINFLSKKGLTRESNVVLKFILTHPDKNQDSIILYLMEGTRWQL